MRKILWKLLHVSLFHIYGAPQATQSESSGNFFQMQKLGCTLVIWTVFYYHLTSVLPSLQTF